MMEKHKNWIFPVGWIVFVLVFFLTYLVPGAYPLSNMHVLESVTQWYPYWVYARDTYFSGLIPLWSPAVFMGIPFSSDPYTGVFHVLFLLFMPFSPARGTTLMFLVHFLAAGLGAYMLARETGSSRTAASSAAMIFVFSGYFFYTSQLFGSARTLSYTPLAFFLLLKAGRTRSFGPILGLAAVTFLQINGGHPEMMLWQHTGLFAVALTRPKRLSALIWATAMGALAGMITTLPTLELASHSVRSGGITREFFFQAELSSKFLLTFLIPYHHPVPETLAPSQSYFGMVSIIFLLVALIMPGKRKRNAAIFAGAVFIILITLSRRPFINIFYHLPLFKITQLHYIAMILFAPAIIVLSAAGFDKFSGWCSRKVYPCFFIMALCAAMALLKLFAFGKVFDSILLGAALAAPTASVIKKRKAVALALLALVAADVSPMLLANYPKQQKPLLKLRQPLKKMARQNEPVRWALITEFGRYNPVINQQMSFLLPPDSRLHSFTGFTRVINIHTGNLMSVLYPEYIRWEDGKLAAQSQDAATLKPSRRELLSLLNVRYVTIHKYPLPDWEDLSRIYSNNFSVYENEDYMPRTWVVYDWIVGTDAEAKRWLASAEEEELRNTVFLAKSPDMAKTTERRKASVANIEEYGPESISISLDAPAAGFLFISDTYYPGWRAWVDGVEAPIYRADIALRAIPVNPGRHKVEMAYEPLSFRISLWVTLVSLITMAGVTVIYARKRRLSKARAQENSTG